jgi:hypothetical protein
VLGPDRDKHVLRTQEQEGMGCVWEQYNGLLAMIGLHAQPLVPFPVAGTDKQCMCMCPSCCWLHKGLTSYSGKG